MAWPSFLVDRLETGNPDSCVAVCTLWSEKSGINIPSRSFSVKGNLYSGDGIKYLLRNLLANPTIRYLVVCGNDRNGSGEELVKLFRDGLDAGGKIKNGRTALDEKLKKDLVEKVRKNVELVDMRGREKEVAEKIKSLPSKKPYGKPVVLEEPEQRKTGIRADNFSGFRAEDLTISEAWLRILDTVMKFGEDKKSEHGMPQKEVLNMMAVIRGREKKPAEWMTFGNSELMNYYETFFGTGSGDGIKYTYGRRLFAYLVPGSGKKWEKETRTAVDQIDNAIRHLKRAPHTRRAAAFTWSVGEDSFSGSPPCLTQITWNIRYGKLFQTAVFRSHDIFGGWPMNAFALRELQEKVSDAVNAKPGSMTIISNSAHIYGNNFDQAGKILETYFTGKRTPFIEDSLGYFTITLKKGEIEARHHESGGRETGFIFRDKSAGDIWRRIIHENLVSGQDHAAYLGAELARAEACIKESRKYVQN